MKRFFLSAALALSLGTAALQGQVPKPGDDPMAKLLFDPQLVLKHAQELALQPVQRTAIINAIKEAQGDLLDLQLQMAERHEELLKVVEGPRVDEAAALRQADAVLGLERDMKRKQLQLLIRIKNALTKEQQERLAILRDRGGNGDDLQ
jgi:Spy/CpxP family protein refolding chaperone